MTTTHLSLKTLQSSIQFLTILTLVIAIILPVGNAMAASITVNSLGDMTSNADGVCTLREALINANNDTSTWTNCPAGTGADVISFTVSGSIVLTSSLPNITDLDGLTINGGTTITISGNNLYRITTVNIGVPVTIQNITLTAGSIAGSGGAIYLNRGMLTVFNSIFSSNHADTNGGAIFANGGTLIIDNNSSFTGNTATNAGGAIYMANGSLVITGSSFTGNHAAAQGGGIYIPSGTANISGTSFTNNIAETVGGALRLNGGTVTVTNNTFSGNTASSGGAIYTAIADLMVSGSSFSNNTVGTDGGAIYVASGILTLSNDNFSTNSADDGGAVFHTATTLLTIENSTFTGNNADGEADGDGGALMMNKTTAGSSLMITGSTFSNNKSTDDGGAIWNNAEPVTITTSTFDGNKAQSGALNAEGGAIYNSTNAASTSITLSTFKNNSVEAATDVSALGGAISNYGSLVLANDTFFGNSVTKTSPGAGNTRGGAVYIGNNATTLYEVTVSNVTFNTNSVTENGTGVAAGGSLYGNSGTLTVANSILSNGIENGVAGNCGGTITNGGPNVDYNGGDCGFAINLDPKLGTLSGSPAYFHLLTGSSAINTGDNTVCASAPVINESQNGMTRPQEDICDLGSFEYENQPPKDIVLLNTSIDEDKLPGTIIDILTTTDADSTTFTYTLVDTPGCLGPDNASFQIGGLSNDQLLSAASLDYETKTSYQVCIRTVDGSSNSFDKHFIISINNVNEAPVLSTSAGTTAFTEGTPIAIDNTVTVSDVDSITFSSGSVSITSNFQAGEDQLLFVNAGGITGSYNSVTGVMSLTGPASMAQWQTALRTVQYSNNSSTPNIATRTISFVINDASLNSNVALKDVSLTSINGAPTGGNGAISIGEDGLYTFTFVDFTTLTTPAYKDDEGNLFAGIQITSLETAGVLQCGSVDIVLNGTCADVTTLTFQPVSHGNGTPYATFSFRVYDGTTYSTSSYIMTINVAAVNDAPSFTASDPSSTGVNAGTQTITSWATFNAGPNESGQAVAQYIISNSTCGTLLSAGPFVDTAGTLIYTPATDQAGTCTFNVQVQDNGGTINSGVDTSGKQNFTITLDVPTIVVSPAILPNGTAGFPYSQSLTASGGKSPYTFTLDAGGLPPDLVLSGTGVISGIPTTNGTFYFAVVATDSSGGNGPYNGSQAYSITIDNAIAVTINQVPGQADPAKIPPVNFRVVFNTSVTGFTDADIIISGTAGATSGFVTEVAPKDGTTYNVAVSGMTGDGTIIASIPASAAADAFNNPNTASTSMDNIVTYDTSSFTVVNFTPANMELIDTGLTQMTVTFSENVKEDGSAGAANNTYNYLLVEDGTDNLFNTLSCVGGRAGDDTQVTINSASYNNNGNSGPFIATLNFNVLPAGTYRLFVCGSTSIEDLAGNKLNNGSDLQMIFEVISQRGKAAHELLPATGFPFNEVTVLPTQPSALAYTSTDLWLEIPKLGAKMSIVGVPLKDGGWDVKWLEKNAGWLNGSAYPTWNGNSVITGHVWDALNKPGPFAGLKKLQYGDQIKIHAFGQVFTYEIHETASITPTSAARVFKHEEKPWLTLITCEDYSELTKAYSSRRIVRAILVNVKEDK